MTVRHQSFSTVSKYAGPLSWLFVFCLLGGLVFFWGGNQSNARPSSKAAPALQVTDTPVKYQTADIKDVHVGERLLGKNPITEEVDDFVPEIIPSQWRLLNLTMKKGNGKRLDMQFLRPLDWIKAHGAQRGATIDLDLPEFGAQGAATVVSIEACPPIRSGKGNVVTGKFIHESDGNLIDLKIEGQQEATTVTANHRYWSADRNEFVEAGHLMPGEHVQTLAGLKQATSITPHPGNETVYNLEVQGQHVYLVGSLGTLVHNNYYGPALPGVRSISDSIMRTVGGPKFGANFAKKVRKHINQVRHRVAGSVDNIPPPNQGGIDEVEKIIRNRVAQGGGEADRYAGQDVIKYVDDGVTYFFRMNGEFWTILGN